MLPFLCSTLPVLLMLAQLGSATQNPPRFHQEPTVVVGAIRWDAWHGDRSEVGKAVERSLGPQKWHARLPFFAKVISEDQVRIDGASHEVMDQEIQYARAAGLEYWAFLLYDESNPMSLGLKHYLASVHKQGLRFCVIVELAHLETAESAARQFKRVSELVSRPEYQKVPAGKPLLYILDTGSAAQAGKAAWGVRKAPRAIEELRRAIRKRTGQAPYIVIQNWRADRAHELAVVVKADAIGSYSYQRDGKNAPYAQLAQEAEQFWDQCEKTGSKVVPIVMTGWDRRPRVERPVFWETWQQPGVGIEKFYQPPTEAELSQHLRKAVEWVERHPKTAPANTILIYAWNENDEGGWLVPTLSGGNLRLRAIRNALDPAP